MRTRHRPNRCEEASVRKRRQPTLLITPAERHQGEERQKEHGHGDLHSASKSEACMSLQRPILQRLQPLKCE